MVFFQHSLLRQAGQAANQNGQNDARTLAERVDQGAIRLVIERVFPFAETPQALTHVETGRAKGKVVITIKTRAFTTRPKKVPFFAVMYAGERNKMAVRAYNSVSTDCIPPPLCQVCVRRDE